MEVARKDIEGEYKKYIKEHTDGAMLSANLLLNLSVEMFNAFKIKGLKVEDPEEDMLLFQYGSNSWGAKLGRHFKLDVVRQFVGSDEEMYQLSVMLVYAPDLFDSCKGYSCWSSNYKNLNDWVAAMKETEGFKQACTMEARLLKVELDKL